MNKYFGIETKDGKVISVCYKVTMKNENMILTLTRQEYTLLQMLAKGTDFPQDFIDQDTGIDWNLWDANGDENETVWAVYTRE